MTKEKAIELAKGYSGYSGGILGVKEYDDIFVITFRCGWETYIVNKDTGEVLNEQELPEEEAIAIARRPYAMAMR